MRVAQIAFVDYERCINCKTCMVACKMEHNLLPFAKSSRVAELRGPSFDKLFHVGPVTKNGKFNRHSIVFPCLYCTDPLCVSSCPTDAVSRLENNVMQVDKLRCNGCRSCLEACPSGVPQFNAEGKMVLCDMCLHRLRHGKKTACEAACVAKCIHVNASYFTATSKPNQRQKKGRY